MWPMLRGWSISKHIWKLTWVPIEDGEEPQPKRYSVIAFSSKQGQPLEAPDFLFLIMVKVRLPREPYEGQIFYAPDNELIFLFENGRWIDVTDLDITKTTFN